MIAEVPKLPVELLREGDDEWVLASGASFGLTDIHLVFPIGSSNDGAEAGLSMLTWEMTNRGTARLDRGDFAAALERFGAEIDFSVRRATAHVTARVLDEYLDPVVDLLGEALVEPRDAADELAELEAETAEGIDVSLEAPDGVVGRAATGTVWTAEPWCHPADGTGATRRGIDRDRIAEHRRRVIAAPTLFGIGSEDPVRALPALRRLRERVRAAGGSAATSERAPERRWGRARIADFDAPQGALLVMAPAPSPISANWAAAVLHSTWFGDGFSSPLVHALRARDGLSYDVSWWLHGDREHGVHLFRCHPEAGNVARALTVAESVWSASATAVRDDEALARAKATYIGGRLSALETVDRRLASALTLRSWGEDVSRLWELPRRVVELSADEVAEAAATYGWGTGQRALVAAVPGGVDATQWADVDIGLEFEPVSLDDVR